MQHSHTSLAMLAFSYGIKFAFQFEIETRTAYVCQGYECTDKCYKLCKVSMHLLFVLPIGRGFYTKPI